MNNQHHSTVLNLHRFASGRAPERAASEESSRTASIRCGARAAADAGARIIAPRGSELPATELLGAVSYCYAKGVYDSTEIEDKMRRSPELRAATHDNVPGASLIRRFRPLNREAIHATLEEAFRFFRRKAKASARAPLPGQPPSATRSGSFDPETTVTFVRKEAERTLNDAAFVDDMSKE
jgi:hypothetical protein